MLRALDGLLVLLGCQLAGEVLSRLLSSPVPGPVLGLILLFAGLLMFGRVPERLERTASAILEHLSLLFVPAGVGVVMYVGLVAREWLPIAVALIAGTLATIAITALLMAWLLRPTGKSDP